MPTLQRQHSELADTKEQLKWIENPPFLLPRFADKLKESGMFPLESSRVEIFQINVGKLCNQTCHHCHVDAGPDRREVITKGTLQTCLDLLREHKFSKVDITGGAPEMIPDFRWFVEEASKLGTHVMVRCNLTIIVANQKYNDLPQFYKEHGVEVISSMPHYSETMVDRQRGNGVFDRSIRALKMLNEVGYGEENSNLVLNLVYNPPGAFFTWKSERSRAGI